MPFTPTDYLPYDFANRRHIGPSPEEMAEINEMQNKIAGIIGLAYAASWASIRMIPDQKEALMMGSSIMSFAHKGAEEAMAYNYVVNRVKH